MAQAEGMIQGLKREAVQVDKKIESLLDRIVETENPRVIAAYEKRLSKLETDKLGFGRKTAKRSECQPIALMICSNSPQVSSQTLGNYGNQVS